MMETSDVILQIWVDLRSDIYRVQKTQLTFKGHGAGPIL